jgi:hypothetical protein
MQTSFVQKTSKKLSKSKMESQPNVTDLVEAVVLLSQNAARRVLGALSPTGITNNTGAATGGPIVAVPVGSPVTLSGLNLAPRAAFNTSLASINNGIATLASYLNTNVFTALASSDSIALNDGTVTANTVPAITTALTGIDGAADHAVASWNDTAGNPANTDTVVVNGKTYTFQTTLTNVDGNVHIGGTAAATATNLANAINASGGTAGTDYAAATVAHTTVSAAVDGTTNTKVNLTALAGGTAGNSYTLTKTGTNGAVSGATFTLGTAADAAMLRSEMNAALVVAKNNFSTLLKAYNEAASFVNAPTIMDNSGGKSDAALTLVTHTTAASTVTSASVSASDCAGVNDANAALLALAKNVSYVAARIGASLLHTSVLNSYSSVLIAP